MSSPRRVLLVHPDADRRAQLRAWLGEAEVIEASSRREAVDALGAGRPTLVLAHPQDFKKLIRDLERHAPEVKRVVLCSANDRSVHDELVQVAADGYEFGTVVESEVEVRTLLRRRRSIRVHPAARLDARFTVAGRQLTGEVLELGNDGLSLFVSEPPSGLLQPGARLEDASISYHGRMLVEPQTWLAVTFRHAPGGVRVGMVFEDRRVESLGIAVDDPVRIRGWIRRAIARNTPFRIQLIEGERHFNVEQARLEPDRLVLTGEGMGGIHAGDVVQLGFDSTGLNTQALVAVLDSSPESLTVNVPRRALHRERRSSQRLHYPSGVVGPTITFTTPLANKVLTAALNDLQTGGASFTIDPHDLIMPPGLRLEPVQLEVEGRTIECDAVVQSTSRVEHGRRRRCGIRFVGLDDQSRQVLLDALAATRLPGVQDASTVPADDIWNFFRSEEVHFPAYPAGDELQFQKIRAVHDALGNGSTGIGKTFVVKDEQGLVGHSSGVRPYSRTWLSQHLLVRSGLPASVEVSKALVTLTFEYGEALPDVEFVRGFWRVQNRWPARIYGSITPRLVRTGFAHLHRFHAMQRDLSPVPDLGLTAVPCEDPSTFYRFMRTQLDPVKLHADDLVEGQFFFEQLGRRYASLGLERSRTLGVVNVDGQPRGWVVLERMTEGLVWIEFFNQCRIFLCEPHAPDAAAVTAALVQFVAEQERAKGRDQMMCLAPPEQLGQLTPLGFKDLIGPAMEFTVHRSLLREAIFHLKSFFERVRPPERETRTVVTQ